MLPRDDPLTPAAVAGAHDKLSDIQAITDAALSRLSARDLLDELLDRVQEVLDADTLAVLLLDHGSSELVATAARGLEDEVSQGVRVPVGSGFAGRVAAERQPVILDKVDDDTVANPVLIDRKIRSLLGVPLLAGGAVVGVMHVGSLAPRAFNQDDAALLQLAADRAAAAVQSLLARDDRVAAAALQRSLLPSALPVVPGVRLAARYVAGNGPVGGDWYDVFPLPGGQIAVIVGDVAGSGLRAAVVMGRMRSALRSYAIETDDPADALTRLDRKMQYFEADSMATVLYAILDAGADKLRVSLAGHPPPVIAAPCQPAMLADVPADPPIGVAQSPPRSVSVIDLPPGAIACFFTDGLIERRGASLDDGIGRLCAAVSPAPPDQACANVMRSLIGKTPPGDDVAVLVLRRDPA